MDRFSADIHKMDKSIAITGVVRHLASVERDSEMAYNVLHMHKQTIAVYVDDEDLQRLEEVDKMSIVEDLRLMFATIRILFVKESTEGIEAGKTTAR